MSRLACWFAFRLKARATNLISPPLICTDTWTTWRLAAAIKCLLICSSRCQRLIRGRWDKQSKMFNILSSGLHCKTWKHPQKDKINDTWKDHLSVGSSAGPVVLCVLRLCETFVWFIFCYTKPSQLKGGSCVLFFLLTCPFLTQEVQNRRYLM